MGRLIKLECYKLLKDRLFWAIILLIILINSVMFAGQDISIDSLAQKMFLTIVIVSLYGTSFIAKDYEEKKIIYEILSGNSKTKILFAKILITALGIQIQLLVFPIVIGFINNKFTDENLKIFLVIYFWLGIFLSFLATMMANIFKSQGLSIGCAIVFHLITLLSVNSSSVGFIMAHILPVGMIKLVLNNYVTLNQYTVTLIVWDLVLLILALICVKKSEF